MRRSFRKSLQLLPVPIAQALLSSETALLVHLSVHQRETSVIRLASCNSRAEAKAGETEDSIRSQSTLYVSLPLDVTREATPLSGASESESSSSVSALAPQYIDGSKVGGRPLSGANLQPLSPTRSISGTHQSLSSSFTASYMSPLLLVAQHAMIAFTTASSVTYSSIAIRMAAAHRFRTLRSSASGHASICH